MSTKDSSPIQQVNTFINMAKAAGIAQLVDEGERHDGPTFTVNGRELVNFGSCGYMNLEFDPRVKKGGMDAIERYGLVLPSSRVFLSNPLYPKLEELLGQVFQSPVLLAPSTTLAHISALPTLVGEDDMVLLDQQVHSSVQLGAKVLKANGTQTEFVAHSNMDRLERKIRAYKDKKKKIWYLGDGVYSMYGDFAPVGELHRLLETYEQFHVYLDDAHGMSWMGKRGSGYVQDRMKRHERLFLVTSLGKGFGTGGGAMICPSPEVKQLIRNCGGPQLFSTPLQPAILGAAIESAKIHLSDEIHTMQKDLRERIDYSIQMLENQPLPQLSGTESPIRFLGVGPTEKAQQIVKMVIQEGFWLNVAQFPAVAPHHAGLRFMLTRKTRKEDIEKFSEAVKKAVHAVIGRDEEAISQIWKAFSKEYRYTLING